MTTKSILVCLSFSVVSIFIFSLAYPSTRPTPLTVPNEVQKLSNWGLTPTPSQVTLGLMGDLGLGRMITKIARDKNDFSWSFSGLSSWLSQNDLNIANLESPIIKNCPNLPPTTFTFCGDSRFLPELKSHKFFFTLANNHILNFGSTGLTQTKDYLSDSNIPFVYSHQIDTEFSRQTINDISFGFIAFDLTGGHGYDIDHVLSLVSKYDSQVDWLIVSLHWGAEYLPQPETWRINLAHQLIDRGADIIHGHHPHVWQEPDTYHGRPIFYSFGNFIFDQNWSYNTSHSNIARLTLTKDKILNQQLFPIEIQQNSRPVLINN